jgi:hypothetical protein
MRSNVAPGPDGFNAAFYNSAWQWAKDDIYKVVKDFYTYDQMPPDINQTFISLIPKKSNLDVPQDYRPISLCDVIYKIIAKSFANRIKDRLPNYVVQAQSAFIAHRHISSNIIITQEIIHSFNSKSWNSNAFLLKIDLAKAFDMIEWNFIYEALHRIGFTDRFISLIRACISHPTFVILVNDEPSNHFNLERGLRQGCPLSPYSLLLLLMFFLSDARTPAIIAISLASLWGLGNLLSTPFYLQMTTFYVVRLPWKKLRQSNQYYMIFVNNRVKLIIFKNPLFISARMSLIT